MRKLFTLFLVLSVLGLAGAGLAQDNAEAEKNDNFVRPYGKIGVLEGRTIVGAMSDDVVVGNYTLNKSGYRATFMVVPNTLDNPKADYMGIILNSSEKHEPAGAVKFFLTQDPDSVHRTYLVKFIEYSRDGTVNTFDTRAAFRPALLSFYMPNKRIDMYHRNYP